MCHDTPSCTAHRQPREKLLEEKEYRTAHHAHFLTNQNVGRSNLGIACGHESTQQGLNSKLRKPSS